MTQASNAPAPGAPAPAAAPAAAPVAPQPGTPEHAAAMVAAYENQPNGPVIAKPVDLTPPPEVTPPTDANTPKPDEPPKPDDAEKNEPEKKEGEPPASVKDLFDKGVFDAEIGTDGKLSDGTLKVLEDAGIPREIIERVVKYEIENAQREAAALEATLHTAAGGKEQFDSLVAWGKQALTPAEQAYFDDQLNGPFAAQAVQILMQKRGAPATPAADVPLHVGGGGGAGPSVGFRSQKEMTDAMSDPRYWSDPAYHADVARRLAFSNF